MVEKARASFKAAQPLYLQMAERLAQGIEEGHYAVGSMLPTEAELCAQFGASRFTVREAIKQLQKLGMVTTRHGTGTEVLARHATRGRFSFSFDSVGEFLHSARETRIIKPEVESVTADRAIARAMGCEVGQPLLRIHHRRAVLTPKGRAARPVALNEAYVLSIYDGIRSDLDLCRTTISDLIESRYGVSTARIEQTIEPCVLTNEQAKVLEVDTGSLGLRLQRRYVSTRGDVFEYVSSVQAGEEARISMTMRTADSG